jgi:thiol-disulfide isomerase/thioredoxin
MIFTLLISCVPILTSPDDSGASSCWMDVENQWESTTPRNLVEEGFGLGQTPPDMCMLDQNGDQVSMWQFFGKVIVLDISAEWCAPCQELAAGVDHTWHEFEDQGFMYLTLLTQDERANKPSQEVLQKWATDYSITAPVLSDIENYEPQLIPAGTAYPRVMLLDRTMTIQIDAINPATDDVIREAIIDAL